MGIFALLLTWALSAQASSNFCVQTFNAYGPFYAPNVETRTEVFVQDLKSNGLCDFLFLQEMWNDNHYTDFSSLMSIDFPIGTVVARADEWREDGNKSGLVAVSKSAIKSPSSFLYNINKDGAADEIREGFGVKKGLMLFDSILFGSKIHFINTHLHQSSTPVRLAQLIQLHQALESSHGYELPWIFTGDLNFKPYSLEWNFLTQVMGFRDSFDEVAVDKNACTYCAENMLSWDSDSRRIDYVLYRSTEQFKFKPAQASIEFKGDAEFPLSDHYGIKIDFVYGEDTPAPQVGLEQLRSTLTQAIQALEEDGRWEFNSYIEYLQKLLEATK